jgi:phospholipid-translocating ATPase
MLTGDKVETAICIAISAGLKSRMHELFTIKKIEDEKEITQKLEQFHYMNNTVLVIDGSTLEVILRKEELRKLFYLASSKAPSVICCRCSPK